MQNQPHSITAAPDAVRSWEQHASFARRFLARLGLQGKLIFCFMYMLALALGVSCWLFARQSSARVSDIMGDQARQITYALSLASKPSIEAGQVSELKRIGLDLLKARNILFVSFLDETGKSLAFASRDPDFDVNTLSAMRKNTESLMQVTHQSSAVLGDYLVVVGPIVSRASAAVQPTPAPGLTSLPPASGSRLLGYVIVGVSQRREQAQLRQINYLIAGVGSLVVLLSLPMSYLMVRRIFLPIRQLVDATDRIAGGDLETQVAIHRPDLIGTLARSFNEMIRKVRNQQEALEDANIKLAHANVSLAGANQLLATANGDLEQKVLERTAQLEAANRQLSKEIAEKEDFLRAVSHDLNAPLRNISGMACMLLMKHREKFDADVVHRLERIQKNVEAETALIAELLELSRIKSRRQKVERINLRALVEDIGDVLENDLRTRNIALVIEGELPFLNAEKARLRQVFQNLIDNAIKYMGAGPTREIHVGCQRRASDAVFYVRDTGVGIDAEDIGKVFFVFRRGKSAAAQGVPGKGVGLASVKSIVETYSGTIWVESTPGEGSIFWFTMNGKYLAAAKDGTSEAMPGESQAPKAA